MTPRLNPHQSAPEAMKVVAGLDAYIQWSQPIASHRPDISPLHTIDPRRPKALAQRGPSLHDENTNHAETPGEPLIH